MSEASEEHVLITKQRMIELIDRAAERIEHHAPHQCNYSDTEHNWQEKYRAVKIVTLQLLIDHHCDQKSNTVLHNRYDEHEINRSNNGVHALA
ncbi:hypothetical protein D3C73_1468610 [compost metagenome]